MGLPAEQKPRSGSASDRWERWMDLMELNWYKAMEAARGEYAEIHDAVQTKTLNCNASRVDSKENRLRNE